MTRACSQRAGNLARYATGMSNEPKEDEQEENAAGNFKHPERSPIGGSHGWGNKNVPTLAPSTLGIPGGAAGRFTKQATTLPAEDNTPSAGTKVQTIHRLMVGGNLMIKYKVGGGNGSRGGT